MAMWKNPATRTFGEKKYSLVEEGIQKPIAIQKAKDYRIVGALARVVVDERTGRHDIVNRDNFYCIYVRGKK
jgi:hypothetical protein